MPFAYCLEVNETTIPDGTLTKVMKKPEKIVRVSYIVMSVFLIEVAPPRSFQKPLQKQEVVFPVQNSVTIKIGGRALEPCEVRYSVVVPEPTRNAVKRIDIAEHERVRQNRPCVHNPVFDNPRPLRRGQYAFLSHGFWFHAAQWGSAVHLNTYSCSNHRPGSAERDCSAMRHFLRHKTTILQGKGQRNPSYFMLSPQLVPISTSTLQGTSSLMQFLMISARISASCRLSTESATSSWI